MMPQPPREARVSCRALRVAAVDDGEGGGGLSIDSVSECGCECKCTWRIDITSHCSLSRVGIYSIIHAIQEIYINEIGNAQSRRARGGCIIVLYFGEGLDVDNTTAFLLFFSFDSFQPPSQRESARIYLGTNWLKKVVRCCCNEETEWTFFDLAASPTFDFLSLLRCKLHT